MDEELIGVDGKFGTKRWEFNLVLHEGVGNGRWNL